MRSLQLLPTDGCELSTSGPVNPVYVFLGVLAVQLLVSCFSLYLRGSIIDLFLSVFSVASAFCGRILAS